MSGCAGVHDAAQAFFTTDVGLGRDAAGYTGDGYLDFVAGFNVPRERAGQIVHRGHCTYLVPEERVFVTPATIRASGGLVGEPDEIIAMLREKEAAGLKEVMILPPMAIARENISQFRREIIDRY